MRRMRFVLAGLTVLLPAVSCTDTLEKAAAEDGGEVMITLSSEARVQPVSKAGPAEVPTGEFTVEIFKLDGESEVRLYRDSYSNTEGKTIGLNTGDYRLYAYYGDPDAAGFDAPYYAAQTPFTVQSGQAETVSAVAKLSNVMVTVEFGETLRLDYPEFYAIVRSGEDVSLQFGKDETREGYVPAGMISLELYANVDGTWKYFPSEPEEYSPNDYVAFYVDTEPASGEVSLKITVDDSVDLVEKEVSIPASMLPQNAPEITFNGFTADDTVEIVEGQEISASMKADIVAGAGLAHCILEIDSDCLSALGVPSEVDLVSVDGSVADILKANGFRWAGFSSGQRLAFIDITGVAEKLASEVYDDENPFSATVRFTVEDMAGQQTVSGEQGFTISAVKPEFSFSVQPTDAWARSIRGMEIGYTVGNPDCLKLQYKAAADGEWQDAGLSSDSGSLLSFNNISGLTPETEYQLRAIYNGNESTAIRTALTTEAAAQVGNSGFEEWQTSVFEFTYNFFGKHEHNIDWYHPWSSEETDIWWAVNSRKTMPSSTSIISDNWNWVRFPTVAYTTESCHGSNAAMLYSVNVGDWLTAAALVGDRVAGELFIGTADDSGNHSSEGHSFGSRPDRLEFMYKYDSNGGETFFVNAELYSEDGTVIAAASTDSGSASSSWLKFSLPFQYTDTARKAARIYVSFKSTSASEPSVTGNKVITIADNAQYTGNFGSVLYLDDLQLIYE